MIGAWRAKREIVSFRVVRARSAYVRSDLGENVSFAAFPFPFWPWEVFPFPFPRPPISYPASAGFIGMSCHYYCMVCLSFFFNVIDVFQFISFAVHWGNTFQRYSRKELGALETDAHECPRIECE